MLEDFSNTGFSNFVLVSSKSMGRSRDLSVKILGFLQSFADHI